VLLMLAFNCLIKLLEVSVFIYIVFIVTTIIPIICVALWY
jgi:hypothetical protein